MDCKSLDKKKNQEDIDKSIKGNNINKTKSNHTDFIWTMQEFNAINRATKLARKLDCNLEKSNTTKVKSNIKI